MQSLGVLRDGLAVLPASGGFRSHELRLAVAISDAKFGSSGGFSRNGHSVYIAKFGFRGESFRGKSFMVKASEDSSDNSAPVAPLHLESPSGQFLSQILQNHPHLAPAAIDQQLENLLTDRDAQKEETPSLQDMLYKRIAEVKSKERQKSLEEIIYCLIVQKFMDKEISMIPPISPPSDPIATIDSWPNQEQKLESVHSAEAFEMIQSHLSLVLGDRPVGPLNTIVQISKLKLGKLYAASIMYGYFLRRVDQRFQLERTMKTLPQSMKEDDQMIIEGAGPGVQLWDVDSMIQITVEDDFEQSQLESMEAKSNKLRSYVMHLDADTLQRYATIRSKAAISLIEKQTQALFGRPDIRILQDGSLDTSHDEVVNVTLSGLTMLVLEAVAFGSFLWDAEDYVESKYHFLSNST
ncbi:UV-B-induced protein At3g17800, chloroplastic-like [Aristolochia californica]|uniref:UV-B-induced protein At3g17800, chloroplastic-like n=1 Tax=Aristolochia californica TaxID=171875 RepID=UPI0035E1F93C